MGRLDLLQEPRPEDAKYLKGRYDNIISELEDDELVYWPADEIPREVFEALIVFFKIMVGGGYGVPEVPTTMINDAIEKAKLRIRRRIVKVSSEEPQSEEDGYF
jgi:hypothetical protein